MNNATSKSHYVRSWNNHIDQLWSVFLAADRRGDLYPEAKQLVDRLKEIVEEASVGLPEA